MDGIPGKSGRLLGVRPGKDNIPRDYHGNRLRWCTGCGAYVRVDRFAAVDAKQCRRCVRLDAQAAHAVAPPREARVLAAGVAVELGRRIAAARRLKALVRGELLSDAEIDAVCGGA